MRNSEILGNETWSTGVVIRKVLQLEHDCSSIAGTASSSINTPLMICWTMPPMEFVKVNVDGNSIGDPGTAGFGGLIRRDDGSWVVGFSVFCGVAGNLLTEFLNIKMDFV